MLVTIIGLSALTVVRVKLRAAIGGSDRATARLYAQSAIEASLLAMYGDPNWRDKTVPNTWQARVAMSDGSFTWKVIDEVNASLTTDRNARVRAYGEGTSGGSVWIWSALVQPPLEVLPPLKKFLANADMEAGTTSWNAWNCTLTASAGAHGGTTCLLLGNRGTIDAEAYQLVTGSIENGATYNVEVWAKMQGSTSDWVTISIKLTTTTGVTLVVTPSTLVGTSWTKVAGALTTSWTGTLLEARWRVFAFPDGGTQAFYIDDARMWADQPLGLTVGPIPGTWRRESQ